MIQRMRRVAVVAGAVVAVAWAATRAASQVAPGAPEITVNSYTEHAQRAPMSCRTTNGEVMVWQSDRQDGRSWGVYGQRYSAAGARVGSEFRVHSHTTGSESHPGLACLADGRFMVVWDSDHPDTVRGVFGQLFDADGNPVGTELQINSDLSSDSVLPAVCSATDGTSVVTWQGYHQTDRHDIFARRVSSTGELLGSEFRVNTHVESTQSRPAIACHPDGEFIVVWDSDVQDGADFGVFGQRYDRDGMPQGFEFQISSTTIGSQQRPRVAVAPGSEFVVVWESRSETQGQYGIFGQRFSTRGPLGSEFRIGAPTGVNQVRPAVATDARGAFVVVWAGEENGGQISGQRYASGGAALGTQFQVSRATDMAARAPSVAAIASGDFSVSWQRHEIASGDDGIAARRFVVCGNGALDPGEACDDGNMRDGDCCSSRCEFEQGAGLQESDQWCPNISPDALVCAIDTSPGRASCDDGNACTSNDTCQFGVCVGGPRLNCDDGNVCTTDSCRSQVGCLNVANTLPCNDGNVCTGPDICRAKACQGGAALTCDDGNICTDDRCDATRGCLNQANNAACDDYNACTTGERCADGACGAGSMTVCDDGNPCTTDRCDPAAGCGQDPNTAACDDGDPCTSGDACSEGLCKGNVPNTCDDANPCTEDRCEPGAGCRNNPIEAACDDGNACTRSDQCNAGRCQGVDAVVCTAVDSCHGPGVCDPATGTCSSPALPDGSPCDDGATCTVGDRCRAGACTAGPTGVPFLVKDINSGTKGSAPVELASTGQRVFFRSDDGVHGRELWMTDGSAGATAMVADINPGKDGSAPANIVTLAEKAFFTASDSADDRELWTSDGTATGTRRVHNIADRGSSHPTSLVVAGNRVFFVAADDTNGRELWSSDGTESGTVLVKDIHPGRCGTSACDSDIADLVAVDGRLFFSADDGSSGRELWTSDGSAAGTVLIDVHPGAKGSQPAFLTAYNGTVVFAADDGTHGKELWSSSGGPASTRLIADLRPGECDGRPCSSSPSYLTNTNGTLFFAVAGGGDTPGRPRATGGSELWISDATSNGTQRVAAVPGLPYVRRALHSNLIFAAGTGVQTALWRSDGTAKGTRSLATAGATAPAWPININGRVFFSGTDPQRGTELWSSDGTESGTVFVHDINSTSNGPVGGSSSPASLTTAGDLLFFSADDGEHGRELWALCR